MGAASFLDPKTRQFEFGMPRPVLQLAKLQRGTLTMCSQLFVLLMGSITSLDLVVRRFTCRTCPHRFPPNLPPRLFRPDGQTQRVGSGTPWAAYSIGYPRIVVQASIHLLSSHSLLHLLFDQFLFNLKSLPLEPLGPKLSTLLIPSPSLFSNLCG